jgi:hypothetical protein
MSMLIVGNKYGCYQCILRTFLLNVGTAKILTLAMHFL